MEPKLSEDDLVPRKKSSSCLGILEFNVADEKQIIANLIYGV